MAVSSDRRIWDALLELHDGAAAVTSDDAGQVDSADQIIDLGSATAAAYFDWTVNISAIDFSSNDEDYRIVLQGSTSATFADTITELAVLQVGDATTLQGGADVERGVGRYVMSASNMSGGTVYRYVRIFFEIVAGTTPSITATSFLSARPQF